MDTLMLNQDEVYQYLGIDYIDAPTEQRINSIIRSADSYLRGAVGDDYPRDDPRAKEIALMYIDELYNTHGMSTLESRNSRKAMDDMILQLKLEMSRKGRG